MAVQLQLKPFKDAWHQIGTLENPAGVKLNQGPSLPLIGVGGIDSPEAADTDQRQ